MKRFFLGGLAALLPTMMTLWVVVALVGFVGDYVARPVTQCIHWSLITNTVGQDILESTTPIRIYSKDFVDPKLLDEGETPEAAIAAMKKSDGFFCDLSKLDRKKIYAKLDTIIPPVLGLTLGFILIFLLGILLRGYVGGYLFSKGERFLRRFPVVGSIYPYARKIVDFFFKNETTQREFQTVVAVPYPSKPMFTLGFVTSDGLRSLNDRKETDFVSVFLPSSPTPMTGYVVFVPKEDVVPLSLTLDQTMGLIISGGVIVPEEEVVQMTKRPATPAVDAAPGIPSPHSETRAAEAAGTPAGVGAASGASTSTSSTPIDAASKPAAPDKSERRT